MVAPGVVAVVYSAFEADAGRLVAVKVLFAADERSRRRFDRERRTMGQTTAHDNIVTMFRSGYTNGNRPYLVMEHMSGGSFHDLVERRGPLPVGEAVDLIVPVAHGLGFAHTTGIIHNDIKPANILISATGAPKLSDFGIAAVRAATVTTQMKLSMAYAAPESFDAPEGPNGEVIDPRDERSDLYSLAATLYALVTGAPPHAGSSPTALIYQILTAPPAPTTHPALDAFFVTALAKDPNDRYPTAAQFIQALKSATNQPVAVPDALLPHTPVVAPALTKQAAADALVKKGVALGALGRSQEAVDTYVEIDRRYGADPDPAIRVQVAQGLYNKGVELGVLGRWQEEVDTYNEVDRRYGADPDLVLRTHVAQALFNKGGRLALLGRSQEAADIYVEIDRRYGADPDPALRTHVAQALFNNGVAVGEAGRSQEAVDIYVEVDRRYGTDTDPVLRIQVAQALFNKGVELGELGRWQEAVDVYVEVDRRYGTDPDPALRQAVEFARRALGG